MIFKKIKLLDQGLYVEYVEHIKQEGESDKIKEYKVKNNAKIHKDLKEEFLQLKLHYIQVMGLMGPRTHVRKIIDLMADREEQYLEHLSKNLNVCELILNYDKDSGEYSSAHIVADYLTPTGQFATNVKTPGISFYAQVYFDAEDIVRVINNIFVETEGYLGGKNGEAALFTDDGRVKEEAMVG